jgi:hypothetical protein
MDQTRILISWFLLYYPGSSITLNQNVKREKLISNRNYQKKKNHLYQQHICEHQCWWFNSLKNLHKIRQLTRGEFESRNESNNFLLVLVTLDLIDALVELVHVWFN